MKLLLISNSTNYKEKYLGWCLPLIQQFLKEEKRNILFFPYAGVNIGGKCYPESYDAYTKRVRDIFEPLGFNLKSVHEAQDPMQAVNEAEIIMVGGGNTFHLVAELHKYKLIEPVRRKVMEGAPYLGWSAGSNVACPSLKTTNDMPIVEPESFACMNIVPFQINPHYTDFFDPKHGGETRDDRLKEYIMVNPNAVVAAIREATALSLEDGKLKLIGRPNKMKVFHQNMANTKEYGLEDDINFLLK